MNSGFTGRHYETGTITNALKAMGAMDPRTGAPYSEALALGASGGIAFGYFVFEYTGHLPHVAMLTRNTFSPFQRALDNLAIKREQKETTDGDRADRNLRLELDSGNVALVWADSYSLPYTGLCADQMWAMRPLLVVGQEGDDFLVVDGPPTPIRLSAANLDKARARVKKDRFRMLVLQPPDPSRLPDGLIDGIRSCTALFLDKPPAGSPNNFGISGMRHFAKMLTDPKNAKGWTKTFQPGPRLVQALAGSFGQPGIWDWVEQWGTNPGADRETYADFLDEAGAWLANPELVAASGDFRESAKLWRILAETAMPDSIPEFKALKKLKSQHARVWIDRGLDSLEERSLIRLEMKNLTATVAESAALAEAASAIHRSMSELVSQIADIEEQAIRDLRQAAEPSA